jgi:hypothetical protein
LSFISYYRNFKLLLCFSCSSSINLTNFKGYLGKHFQDLKSKTRNIVISKVISILQDLEVSSLFLSLELLQNTSYCLLPFKELNIISNLFQYFFCSVISINKANIKKHLRKNYRNKLQEIPDLDLLNSYIVIAKGQNLEANRFYFQVESKDKNKKQDSINIESSLEEQEEQEKQEDFFTTAKSLFLQGLEEKEEKLQKKLSVGRIVTTLL